MRRIALFGVLAACQPAEPEFPELGGMTGVEETECTGAGGRVVMGLAGPACAMPTADAGRSCLAQSECETNCLAPADGDGVGHCAPVTPIFGCHDIFLEVGERVTICVD